MGDKGQGPSDSSDAPNKSRRSSSESGANTPNEVSAGSADELPTFECDDWSETPTLLGSLQGPTETIDLEALLNKDVSTTGSFAIREEIRTSTFGKMLQALPIPAFLIDTALQVLQVNQACSRISNEYESVLHEAFPKLICGDAVSERIELLLKDLFSDRKTRVHEAILKISDRKIWARMTFRSVRIMQDRFALALIEDLTNEKKQLHVNEKLRRELEERVEKRTATLVNANERLRGEIDQRKRAEKALRENQQRFKAVLEHMPDLLWMKDRDGIFQLVNKAFAEACGIGAPEQLTGKYDWDIWPKEFVERYRRDDSAVMESGQSKMVEEPIIYKGVTNWFETSKTPLFDEDGKVVGTIGSARDITQRRAAEQALRDSEEKYRNILETIADGYHEVDLVGNLTLVNDSLCEIIGYSREELLGLNYRELMNEANAEIVAAAYNRVYRTGNPDTGFDCEVRRKDGTTRQISISIALKRDSEHQASGFRGVLRDVTEHRRLEDQLRQAAKMEAIGRLAGGIAHDFNNLLTAVMGYSNLLMQELPAGDTKRDKLLNIARAAGRAAALTRQLLAFSRKQVLEVRVLNINDVINQMEDMLRPLIGENIELFTSYRSPLGSVRADRGQIEQIVLNLALNARDAMPHGGRLIIETSNVLIEENYSLSDADVEPGLYVMFAIGDSGIGMDTETMSHIFDPFFTTKAIGMGTGLGLATVYGIVKQHNGHVVVESHPGRGTKFKVHLPLVEEEPHDPAVSQTNDSRLGGEETILVVEDEEVVRDLVCQALETLGYQALSAGDPLEAIAICDNHEGPIHLLLSDVVLPQMDGRTLYNKISEARSKVKVLYMSGYTENYIVDHGVLDPGVHFLPKPFTVESLASKLREILDESE